MEKNFFSPRDTDVQEILARIGSTPLRRGAKAEDLIKRPEIKPEHIYELIPEMEPYDLEVLEQAAIQVKYQGYIDKQKEEVKQFLKLEGKELPQDLDYDSIHGLSNEAKQRLSEVRPLNVGQASRISGVNPTDISVILIYLEQRRRKTTMSESTSKEIMASLESLKELASKVGQLKFLISKALCFVSTAISC
jgi:tRNA uridine 5-carboxymethylaminomethyl modification enzyme